MAVLLSVGLGLLVAFVMLFPVGANVRAIIPAPGEPAVAERYSWSLGSFLFLGPLSGGLLEHLNIGSIVAGVAFSVLAGVLPYWLVMRHSI